MIVTSCIYLSMRYTYMAMSMATIEWSIIPSKKGTKPESHSRAPVNLQHSEPKIVFFILKEYVQIAKNIKDTTAVVLTLL